MSVENHPNLHAVGFTVDIIDAFQKRLRGNAKAAKMQESLAVLTDELLTEFVTKLSEDLDKRFGG